MTSVLETLRALADPTRIRVVHLLRTMELSVGEIAQVMAQSQPRVSRHIRILAEAGLVERRREGNWVFLRLGQSPFCRNLLGLFDAMEPDHAETLWLRADTARLAAVRADRARAADGYFSRHAEHWDAIRSLYVDEADVETAMVALVERHEGGHGHGHFLDVGTGTGRMIQVFGGCARAVTAIDRSPDMLRVARAKLPPAGADTAEKYRLMLGDFCDLPLGDASVDLTTLHQVLHYAPDPAAVIGEAARVLRAGGLLLIADFAPHEREELRLRDQHTRLGFSDRQIDMWFAEAGLDMAESVTLAGGELTLKLWLGRRFDARIVPIGRAHGR